ncbi:MAG: FTR1 family protein, partial [Candidatus Heimdallarchaeota archaeon]|nr:FTR1 family protein [Candidatus Heimdallarchaeota archaeon]
MVLFSLAAFFITLRETMEAALIIGILLAYLAKTGNDQFKKDIWIGTVLAIIASIVSAIAFEVFRGGFEGDDEKIFEGIVMILAAAVLTWMIVWMISHSRTLKFELEEKTKIAVSENKKYAMVGIAFISVFREGIETVLFLATILEGEGVVAGLSGALTGILVASVLAVLLFQGSINLDLRKFFNITSVVLILFAAGLFA